MPWLKFVVEIEHKNVFCKHCSFRMKILIKFIFKNKFECDTFLCYETADVLASQLLKTNHSTIFNNLHVPIFHQVVNMFC